jgi:hypothetical protein
VRIDNRDVVVAAVGIFDTTEIRGLPRRAID